MEATTKSRSQAAREYAKANPQAVISDIMREAGVSRSVARRAKETIYPSGKGYLFHPDEREKFKGHRRSVRGSDDMSLIPSGEQPANAEEALLLSWFYDRSIPMKERIVAHTRLTDLRVSRAASQAGVALGPKPPITESELIRRLADLLEGAGKLFAKKAWREAFVTRPKIGVRKPCPNPESNGSAEPNDSSAPSSVAGDTQSLAAESSLATSADTPSKGKPETSSAPTMDRPRTE